MAQFEKTVDTAGAHVKKAGKIFKFLFIHTTIHKDAGFTLHRTGGTA
jgi:hypothetical protein